MRYAVNVSLLETFNRYLHDRCTMQQLKDTAFKASEATQYMDLGTAFHAVLEDPEAHRYTITNDESVREYYGVDGMLAMTEETVNQALVHVPVLGSRELTGKSRWRMPDGNDLVVTMRLDHLLGSRVIDHKSKWSQPPNDYQLGRTVEQYLDSMQGLYYIHAFQCDSVQYVIYWMNYQYPLAEIEHIQTVTLTAPDNLVQLLQHHAEHFYEWAGNVGLLPSMITRAERTTVDEF